MDRIDSPSSADPPTGTGIPVVWTPSQAPNAPTRLDQLPREVGALLLATGMITGVLPPPPGPFDISLMVAGGIALWPRALQGIEVWTRRRFPRAHRAGMSFVDRYLDDLERRYPGATNAVEYERMTFVRMLGDLARGGPDPTRSGAPPQDSTGHPVAPTDQGSTVGGGAR